jgi:putative membrane protein insertion efficiency factor
VIPLLRRWMWVAGWPVRVILLSVLGAYRLTLGQVVGGNCRFYPSCSRYSELAIREMGAARGVVLTVWRVLRCSPLTLGGVDYPPHRRSRAVYDAAIHEPVGAASATGARMVGTRR